jgi:ketosteroid isomerase-like protein
LYLVLLFAGAAPANALPAPEADQAAVLAPLHALFAAFETGDAAAMLRQVYPDGRVTASGLRADGAASVRQLSWTQFAERVRPNNAFQERISDPVISIDGDIAMVWAPYVVRVGGRVSNCGYDLFDLVRENGAWKVMNLTFSSRTTGCPSQ